MASFAAGDCSAAHDMYAKRLMSFMHDKRIVRGAAVIGPYDAILVEEGVRSWRLAGEFWMLTNFLFRRSAAVAACSNFNAERRTLLSLLIGPVAAPVRAPIVDSRVAQKSESTKASPPDAVTSQFFRENSPTGVWQQREGQRTVSHCQLATGLRGNITCLQLL